jgi:23S rRNA (cytidine1920-2'-O)/16S rRNA (cytidine1409-2'-O)-methyltransferase
VKVRLDHLVVRRGLAESGAKAQALILAGQVQAPGLKVVKPGALVAEDQPLSLLEPLRYVSRGGEKLAGALKEFGVDPLDKVCLDVGASTGGFTDCLLQNGARLVMAVDVGHGQLHWKLRQDRRVVNRERLHVLELTRPDVEDLAPALVTVDVSFISLEKVLPHLAALLAPGTEVLALVKPQFEAGPKNAPKGVVRNPRVRADVIDRVKAGLRGWGFRLKADAPCVLKGPKGNLEHFLYFAKT